MTSLSTIARPYAKAAFEYAKAAHQLPLWSQALKNLSIAVQDKLLNAFIKNPSTTKKQLCDFLIDFLHSVSGNGSTNGYESIENFICVLAEKKRLLLLPSVSIFFEDEAAKEQGYIPLTVTSAFAMDEAEKNKVTEKLSKQLHSDLHIQFLIDPNVMGGLLVRSKDWVLDGTIKGQLTRLKSALI